MFRVRIGRGICLFSKGSTESHNTKSCLHKYVLMSGKLFCCILLIQIDTVQGKIIPVETVNQICQMLIDGRSTGCQFINSIYQFIRLLCQTSQLILCNGDRGKSCYLFLIRIIRAGFFHNCRQFICPLYKRIADSRNITLQREISVFIFVRTCYLGYFQ